MTKLQIAEQEIQMVLGTAFTSTELRLAIELYLPVDTDRAREETETLESLFSTRFYAAEEDLVTVRDQNERMSKRTQRDLKRFGDSKRVWNPVRKGHRPFPPSHQRSGPRKCESFHAAPYPDRRSAGLRL